jgi:hypothetical protein
MDISKFTQSQSHGLFWDNEIRTKVFKLYPCLNDTKKYDIDFYENIFNKNENISIKTTGSSSIDCGDILRFYDIPIYHTYTIILIRYNQNINRKEIIEILEIDYNKKLRDILFGSISREEIESYIYFIKSIKKGIVDKEIKLEYIKLKKELEKKHEMYIHISPKVDSKSQRRVQCSIPKLHELFKKYPEFITYKSLNPIIRGIEITKSIESKQRKRN